MFKEDPLEPKTQQFLRITIIYNVLTLSWRLLTSTVPLKRCPTNHIQIVCKSRWRDATRKLQGEDGSQNKLTLLLINLPNSSIFEREDRPRTGCRSFGQPVPATSPSNHSVQSISVWESESAAFVVIEGETESERKQLGWAGLRVASDDLEELLCRESQVYHLQNDFFYFSATKTNRPRKTQQRVGSWFPRNSYKIEK